MERMRQSDAELAARIASGEAVAFEALYGRYKRPVFAYLVSLIGSRSEAEDLLQDVFIGFLKNVSAQKAAGGIKRFLFTIARSRAIDFIRRRQTRKTVPCGESCFEDSTADVAGAGAKAAEDESANLAGAFLKELPTEQREVVFFRIFAGFGFAEIAELLGTPQGTVASRYRRAITRLSERMRGTA